MSLNGNLFEFGMEAFNLHQTRTFSSKTYYFGGVSFLALGKRSNDHQLDFRFAVFAFFNCKETDELVDSVSVQVSYDGNDDEDDQEMFSKLDFAEENSHACVYSQDVKLQNFPDAPCQVLFSVHVDEAILESLKWPSESFTLWQAAKERRFTDVSIKVQGAEFAAHKLVLSIASTVFAAMFSSGMRDASTGDVVIEDTDAEAFQEFLRFAYTGYVSDSETIDRLRGPLLGIADKYDVPPLKLLATHDANMMLRMVGELFSKSVCKMATIFKEIPRSGSSVSPSELSKWTLNEVFS